MVSGGTRRALLIATDVYSDTTFGRLRAPQHDAHDLANVLANREIGDYRVDVLANAPSHVVRIRINELFTEASSGDLILLYVSGHGVKDESGQLHIATTDTRRTLLAATAISAPFIRELIDHSPARRVVVWLDCCYAGAFPAGRTPKASGSVDVLTQLTGRGCAVMTASTHIQYAFERGVDPRLRGMAQPSVFTHAIVEGLRTGDADLNADGTIDAAELYSYVYDKVKASTPEQTPTRNDQVSGELYIARSNRGMWLHPDLPIEIRQNLRSTRPGFRSAAIAELTELAKSGNEFEQIVATDTLRQLGVAPAPQPAAETPTVDPDYGPDALTTGPLELPVAISEVFDPASWQPPWIAPPAAAVDAETKRRKRIRLLAIFGAIGLLITSGIVAVNIVVNGHYFVGEGSGGEIAIFQGVRGSFLWISLNEQVQGSCDPGATCDKRYVDDLMPVGQDSVRGNQSFGSINEAQQFIQDVRTAYSLPSCEDFTHRQERQTSGSTTAPPSTPALSPIPGQNCRKPR